MPLTIGAMMSVVNACAKCPSIKDGLLQVLEAMVERLMDFEEKVRSSAMAALCEAATKDLQVLNTAL